MCMFTCVLQHCFCCYLMLIPGIRCDEACLTVAVDVLTPSWFDLLLPRTSHTRIDRDYWRPIRCGLTRDKSDEDLHDKKTKAHTIVGRRDKDLFIDPVSDPNKTSTEEKYAKIVEGMSENTNEKTRAWSPAAVVPLLLYTAAY